MMSAPLKHSFHIPVMGIGFTIDTPIKVAPYGISSAISLVDDMLIEKMRGYYCRQANIPYLQIIKHMDDFRAKRITAYLDVMDELVRRKFEEIKEAVNSSQFEKYIKMMPTILQENIQKMVAENEDMAEKVWDWVKSNLSMGSIDVNIMTKLDKDNYKGDEKLPVDYNDAHAALRGFAQSKLESAIVLSAGMNPRLYSYFENFGDFFPNEEGKFKKKIILKVSDYRSALIQGKFLAKKGLWVSEYRIESGLNCGGHAFATDGFLMGPILEEFKNNRNSLIETTAELFFKSLQEQGKAVPTEAPALRITAQGGVGTSEEHEFLLEHYQLDSIGWGTPFLLVPEAVSIDPNTLNLISEAKEEDLYLSDISPLGVPFNNVRGNTIDLEKEKNILKGRPGSSCPKKYASLNTEFTEKVICTASRQYQNLKIKELDKLGLDKKTYNREYDRITVKSCVCKGLGTAALVTNDIERKVEGEGISICPGPNMAYYSEEVSLAKMVDHIYGRDNVMVRKDRPFIFVKELSLYVAYFKNKLEEIFEPLTPKQIKYFDNFRNNLNGGISYYRELLQEESAKSRFNVQSVLSKINELEEELNAVEVEAVKV